MTDIPLYFQPTEPSSGVYLVAIDGDCEGGAQAELACHLWLNTVLIPGELATPDYNRAWSLRTVLPLLKRAPEAGDRGTFLTVYEVQTNDVEQLLAERSKRIAAAVQAAPAPFGPIVKGMKELSAIAYKALTGVMTRANTPPAPFGNKATPPVPEPPPIPGTRRFLLAVGTTLKGPGTRRGVQRLVPRCAHPRRPQLSRLPCGCGARSRRRRRRTRPRPEPDFLRSPHGRLRQGRRDARRAA